MKNHDKEKVKEILADYFTPDVIDKKFSDRKIRTVLNYSSKRKMRTVCRWASRIRKAGKTVSELADTVGVKQPRISEWMTFVAEPKEANFLAVQRVLEKWGV